MSEWLDIDSAPKDGTQILLWDGDDQIIAEFVRRKDGSAFWEVGRSEGLRYSLARAATHWMPLPDPPTD